MKSTFNLLRATLVGALAIGAAAISSAITFSNVSMTFTPAGLGTSASWVASGNTIDFTTPNFQVGDFSFGPARTGQVTIMYEAESSVAMMSDRLVLALLGGLSGTGAITISEVIEDLVVPGIIGQLAPTVINTPSQLPFVADINFSRATTKIKATKVITIEAPDANTLDFARVGLVEQSIGTVPEPLTMSVLAIGALGVMRKRRKK